MKKIFLFSIACFLAQFSFGQDSQVNAKPDISTDPKFQEFKKRHDAVTMERQGLSKPSSYYGYDETLRSYFIDNIIPSQTPTSAGYSTKSEYLKVLNDWISKNKHLLKPEHKNSLISE
jgi:hypothetical protein